MKMKLLAFASMAMLAIASNLLAVEADIDGATPGTWTMDLDAAKKMAAEKHLPILLDFSGSDWCGWCQLMESNVFSQPEWEGYATNHLMMVFIDFPNDKNLVPEKYVARNDALSQEYGIEGFPTFVVLDDDGKTELGRLGAGRDKTPESFKAELQQLFRTRQAEMVKYTATLNPEDQAAFSALTDKLASAKQALKEQERVITEASEKAEQLEESIGKLEEEIQMFRIGQLGEDKLEEFKDLKMKLEAANKKLEDWITTRPDRTEENMKLFQEMRSEIQELEKELSKY